MSKNLDKPITENWFFDKFWTEEGTFSDSGFAAGYLVLGNAGGGCGLLSVMLLTEQWWLWSIAMVLYFTVLNGLIFVGKLSPLYKVNNVRYYADGSNYDNYYSRRYNENYAESSRTLLYQIMALPPEDRKLFPRDLMATLSRDLLPTARYEINKGLEEMLNDIEVRNAQRKLMEQKAIYHEGVIAAIESARENIQIETNTLKDFQ